MWPQPEMSSASSVNKTHHSPPFPPPAENACDPHGHGCRWWPYSNSNDFGANAATILIILLCALICALALNTAIRCFLRRGGHHHPPRNRQQTDVEQQKPSNEAGAAPLVVAPTLVYLSGMRLGGAEAECAICLSEFVEGEGIRVLGSCKHGFHVHCIGQWLSRHSSCPTCRRSCLLQESCTENGLNNISQPPAPEQLISIP